MPMQLADHTALVTGATGGLGTAFVHALADAGADVAVHFHSAPDEAQELVRAVEERGRRAIAVGADIADCDDVSRMFDEVDATLGAVTLLVNNAGMDGERGKAWEIAPDEWRRVVEVNLFGSYHCAREALRRMVPRRAGVIVNVSSVHEVVPWGGYSHYCASKAALGMFTKTAALEAAAYGVRLVSLAPGAIRTPINEHVWKSEEGRRDLERKIPMRRIGTPEEMARLVVALASDAGSYVTGATVLADGGMALYADFLEGG